MSSKKVAPAEPKKEDTNSEVLRYKMKYNNVFLCKGVYKFSN